VREAIGVVLSVQPTDVRGRDVIAMSLRDNGVEFDVVEFTETQPHDYKVGAGFEVSIAKSADMNAHQNA